MNLLVSVAVKVIPEDKSIEITDVHTELVPVSQTPEPSPSEFAVPEVLASETEETTASETPSPIPSETLPITLTPTPTETTEITASPTPSPIVTGTSTPTGTPTPSPTATPTDPITPTPTIKPITAPVSLDALFTKYADFYHVDIQLLKKIAKCESNFNANAVGPKGLYVGMFQFGDGSWQSIRRQEGQDPNPSLRTSAEESIKTASYALSLGRASMWPNCSK